MIDKCGVIFVALLGILCCEFIDCTSSHNLHSLLRHPHYAEGHQHALQHHLQHSASNPPKRIYDSRLPYSSPYSSAPSLRGREAVSNDDDEDTSLGPWSRTAPVTKDYYKMNGYVLKSTSATKSVVVIDPQIPQELSEVREANEHFVRMRLEAGCRIPRPQVICVRDVYPGKNFLPRCTLLHRCSEKTGCCEEETKQCSPKVMQEVVMLFYVLGGDHRSTNVEKLLFVNHTECECQTKPNNVSTIAPTIEPTTVATPTPKNTEDQFPLGDQKYNKCRSCPAPFHFRELEDGLCSCDCFDRHKPCIRVKRGREALSDGERRCVLAGECSIPECDYGKYDPDRGRCPRRPDLEGVKGNDLNGKRPIPNHKNPHHRWTYFERD